MKQFNLHKVWRLDFVLQHGVGDGVLHDPEMGVAWSTDARRICWDNDQYNQEFARKWVNTEGVVTSEKYLSLKTQYDHHFKGMYKSIPVDFKALRKAAFDYAESQKQALRDAKKSGEVKGNFSLQRWLSYKSFEVLIDNAEHPLLIMGFNAEFLKDFCDMAIYAGATELRYAGEYNSVFAGDSKKGSILVPLAVAKHKKYCDYTLTDH